MRGARWAAGPCAEQPWLVPASVPSQESAPNCSGAMQVRSLCKIDLVYVRPTETHCRDRFLNLFGALDT